MPGRRPVPPAPSRAQRLRRAVSLALRPPRRLRPTRAGWCFFAIALGVGFAALNTGNNLLYLVLSLLLAFLVLSGVLSESALRGIEVRRRLPRELHAGATAHVAIEIRNAQRRVPAFAVVVEDCLGSDPDARLERAPRAGRCFALRIAPGAVERRGYGFVPEARGQLDFAGIRVSTRFPFGLFSKERTVRLPGSADVFPALEPGAPPAPPAALADEDGARAKRARAGGEVSAVRELEPGDSLRRVHWRASLRRQQLLVRDPEASESARVVVRLATADGPHADVFEARVRRAAAQVVAHLERGDDVGLATDTESIAPASGDAQRLRLLGFLAFVEPDGANAAPASPRSAGGERAA
ncbi:MAG: DUF58 domain-containing protein [Myxococcota bacterium]